MRVKREEMMARRGGRSKSRIKNAQAGSEPASERSNGKLFLLAVGQLFLGNEIPEEAPTRRRIAKKKKKSEEEGRPGGWVVRPLGVTSTCFL